MVEFRHSFHQIDSIALTQAGVNQLPVSSDVNNRAVSVGSSVSDKEVRKARKVHKSQNEEGEDMLTKANAMFELF